MPKFGLSRRATALGALGAVVVIVGAAFAFEPFTRTVIARDGLCLYCHTDFDASLPNSLRHPEDPEKGEAVTCIECHQVPGFMGTVYTYAHLASITDFYGGFRSAYANRAGDWVPPLARRAFRVRDGVRATHAASCTYCHTLTDPKPKKKRGQRMHKKAEEKKDTCINCHFNLVHREVDPREEFVR